VVEIGLISRCDFAMLGCEEKDLNATTYFDEEDV
jgi:hypothetical protein